MDNPATGSAATPDPRGQEEAEAASQEEPTRPRAEVVWTKKEIQRLDKLIGATERKMARLPQPPSGGSIGGATAEERTLSAELKRLKNRRRNLHKWLTRATKPKAPSASVPAEKKPPAQRASKNGTKHKQPSNSAENSRKSQSKTGNRKLGKGLRVAPSDGSRPRVRFVSGNPGRNR